MHNTVGLRPVTGVTSYGTIADLGAYRTPDWVTVGSQPGRMASKAAIASACCSVSATAYSPSSSRQRAKSGSGNCASVHADGTASERWATPTAASGSGSSAGAANTGVTVRSSASTG